ncbi:MAG TPA: sulfite exporter TauE/SafE family protein, partial [Candidatus Acidoferrales bacterium]|nr:sulfite exporter TauE/SafE family protein [Candidatus Acidoferrales bacterium]
NQPMDFPISGSHINPVVLAATGFLVGMLGGFFGVGGSFLAGPALFFFGVPMNFVVGTDLAHIVGKSITAAREHSKLGHIDFKLGLLMMIGTVPGVEAGAQAIEYFKRHANVNQAVAIAFIGVLILVAAFMAWESIRTMRLTRKQARDKSNVIGGKRSGKGDISALAGVAKRIHVLELAPMINLPKSGIKRISLWTILVVAFVGGVFSGFLGGGAGYIRMPALVYLLGIPTHLAVGTDLFEVIISGGYGTVSHAFKGNVDILIALIMQTGGAIGAHLGATLTTYFRGPKIRLAFVPLPLAGAALIIYTLMTGHHLG